MYAEHPEIAKEFQEHTKGPLPVRLGMGGSNPKARKKKKNG